MVDLTSSTFVLMFSLWVSREGNLPALFRPGPRIRGICLIRDSEARKASYFLAEKEARDAQVKKKKKSMGVQQPDICAEKKLCTELLDQLLVLVELLESLNVHVRKVSSFGFITVLLVSQHTDGELGPGESPQPAYRQTS